MCVISVFAASPQESLLNNPVFDEETKALRGGVICHQPAVRRSQDQDRGHFSVRAHTCFKIFFCRLAGFGRALRTGHASRRALLLRLVKSVEQGRKWQTLSCGLCIGFWSLPHSGEGGYASVLWSGELQRGSGFEPVSPGTPPHAGLLSTQIIQVIATPLAPRAPERRTTRLRSGSRSVCCAEKESRGARTCQQVASALDSRTPPPLPSPSVFHRDGGCCSVILGRRDHTYTGMWPQRRAAYSSPEVGPLQDRLENLWSMDWPSFLSSWPPLDLSFSLPETS